MMRFKRKGVTLAATAIAIIAWMFLGYIAFIVMASPFSVLASARTARQAEQYAEFVASSLRLVDYDELDTAAHARRSLAGEIADADDWESSVTLSDERQFGEDSENVQRIATVDIYRTGDTLSRYTLQVPLSSANSGMLFPDWSKAELFLELTGSSVSSKSKAIEKDGYLLVDNTIVSGLCVVYINKAIVSYAQRVNTNGAIGDCSFIPVKKGDVITLSCLSIYTPVSGQTGMWVYYIPFKH